MPNSAIVYSGDYQIYRLRRRRDLRVQELLRRRSSRVYQRPPPITMCRITKLVIYFIIFFLTLAVFTACMAALVYHFRIPADKPAEAKMPGLCTVPGTFVGDDKHIVWGLSQREELGAIRRLMARHVEPYGPIAETRLMGCNLDYSWGYTTRKPCILLKITKSLGFNAVTYDTAASLPAEASDDLYMYVMALTEEQRPNRIWVDCEPHGEAHAKLDVKVDYIPERYFESEYLFNDNNVFLNVASENDNGTYTEDPSVRRLMGVQFQNIPPNKAVYIHCQVWAKNIPLEVGSAKFMMRLMERVKRPEVEILEYED